MLPHCAYHSLDFLIHIVLRVSMLLYLDLDHLFSQLCSSIYSVILQVTYLFLNWCMFKIFLFFFFSYKHFSKGHFYTCILVSFRINISWIWIININNCWVIDIWPEVLPDYLPNCFQQFILSQLTYHCSKFLPRAEAVWHIKSSETAKF